MSSNFANSIDEYYKAKKPYTELLNETIAQEKPEVVDSAVPQKSLTDEADPRDWVGKDVLKIPDWDDFEVVGKGDGGTDNENAENGGSGEGKAKE